MRFSSREEIDEAYYRGEITSCEAAEALLEVIGKKNDDRLAELRIVQLRWARWPWQRCKAVAVSPDGKYSWTVRCGLVKHTKKEHAVMDGVNVRMWTITWN